MPTNYFYIYAGNNSYLVRDALLKRGNWDEVKLLTCTFLILLKICFLV
jgi:hypothetical protein